MPQYDRESDISYKTLAKNDISSTDIFKVTNGNTGRKRKLTVETMLPSLATSGTGSEQLYVSITNKNQLNFKGIKSGDTGLLTVATTTNNIVLTVLEAGIDLSLCNNATSAFLTGVDFTGTVTGECAVINGGTGLSTIAKGQLLYANADNAIAATTAMSTNGQLLIGNATNGYPSVATLTAGTNMTVTNGAGSITLAATLETLTADLDCAGFDIDLHTGYLSADGSSAGIRVTGNNSYFGASANYFNDDQLNLGNGGIRFGNTFAPTIKPNATTSSTAGKAVTIEGGASAAAAAGNLNLTGGTASGNGAGGSVIITAGRDTSGSSDGDIQLKTYTGGTATAGLTVAAEGQNVTVDTGNLVITEGTKGIIHTGSGTGTQTSGSPAHTDGVTINATSGIITLAAVALNAATNAEFTFTNSTIQADSVILLTMQDANTTNNAQLACALVSVTGGSCVISIHNPAATGATSATASKIHFLVINNS
jgi:hypothetical protein